jgi:hypothetical protein
MAGSASGVHDGGRRKNAPFTVASEYVDVIRPNGEPAPFHDAVLRKLLTVVRPRTAVQNQAAVSNDQAKVADKMPQAALNVRF